MTQTTDGRGFRGKQTGRTAQFSTVYIWSPDFGGHHLMYARLVVEHLETMGIASTLVLNQSGLVSTELGIYFGSSKPRTLVLANLRSLLAQVEPGCCVLVPHADKVLSELLRIRLPEGIVLRGLVMRPSRTVQSLTKRLPKALLTLLLNARSSMRIAELAAIYDGPKRFVPQVPDPVVLSKVRYSTDDARSILGLNVPKGTLLGSVVGLVTGRKRADVLVGALAGLDDNHHVLIAGHQGDDFTRSAVDDASRRFPTRVHVRNTRLSEDDFAACICASDYVAALHRHQISSGVVVQALAAGKPVLVAAGTPMAKFVNRLDLGRSTEPDAVSAAQAIRQLTGGQLKPRPVRLPSVADFVSALLGIQK